jgi:hypothetical protein
MRGTIVILLALCVVSAAQERTVPDQEAQERGLRPVSGTQRRVALVIGNNAYPDKPLHNAINDATAVSDVLKRIGFDVETRLNATLLDTDRAIEQFVDRIRPGDVALFYFSGHGVQINEQNYLIPIDFQAKTAADARHASYALQHVQENIEEAGAELQILILDACRDNPYRGVRGAGGGLAAVLASGRGTYIAFATAPGRTASDSPDAPNGLFSGELVKAMQESGLSLDQVFNRVRARVVTSHPEQVPWSSSSVVGEFCFVPPCSSSSPPPPGGPVIERIIADPEEIGPGESVALRAIASNPDSGPLQYFWSASAGRIEGRGATALFSAGLSLFSGSGTSVVVSLLARSASGQESRRDTVVRLKVQETRATAATIVKTIPEGGLVEVSFEGRIASGGKPSGVIEAVLENSDNAWLVTHVQGGFPQAAFQVAWEGQNCRIVRVVELPGPDNGWMRARATVQPIDPRERAVVRLSYQILAKGKIRR